MFAVTLFRTFVAGPRTGESDSVPLGFHLGAQQGVATLQDAQAWLEFMYTGSTWTADDGLYRWACTGWSVHPL